jgi:hypothetical protein
MNCGILRRISVSLAMLAMVPLAAPRARAQAAPAAQGGQAGGGGPVGPSVFNPPAPPKLNPRLEGPQDFAGYWVSVVTEDWRYRMMTPDKNDFPGVPLNTEGRRIANEWDPAKDEASGNQCKAYGAAAIMRVPTRLHITWVDDNTMKVETDAGEQTREFHFYAPPPPGTTPSWQGYSVASWEGLRPRGFVLPVVAGTPGGARRAEEGYLKVVTTDLRPGYLRKNGLPYGTKATVEEYFDGFTEAGTTWLIVTTIVTDPEFMDSSFITSSQFKKLPDASGWNPTPCTAK